MVQTFIKYTSLRKIISLWTNSTFEKFVLHFVPTKKEKNFIYIYMYIYIYIYIKLIYEYSKIYTIN